MWLGGPGLDFWEHGERFLSLRIRSDRYRDSPDFPCSVPAVCVTLTVDVHLVPSSKMIGGLLCSVVCFLLGNSPASEFYMPTFRNTFSVPSS